MECGESGGGGPKRYSAIIPLSVSAPKRSIEKEVRSMEPFRKLCETAEPRLGRVAVAISVRWRESSPFASECLYRARRFKHHCDPGISMVNVMYPFSVPDGVDARFWDRINLGLTWAFPAIATGSSCVLHTRNLLQRDWHGVVAAGGGVIGSTGTRDS